MLVWRVVFVISALLIGVQTHGELSPYDKKLMEAQQDSKVSLQLKSDKTFLLVAKKEAKEDKIKLKNNKDKVKNNSDDKLTGLEKQKVKKSEQVQKELDKGSEQGQTSREGRKKWWKFWE